MKKTTIKRLKDGTIEIKNAIIKGKNMTNEEIKQIERVIGKPISKIDEIDIPTFIRNRNLAEVETLEEEAERIKDEYWAEKTARSDEQDLENAWM